MPSRFRLLTLPVAVSATVLGLVATSGVAAGATSAHAVRPAHHALHHRGHVTITPPGSISGTVTSAGAPLGRVLVRAIPVPTAPATSTGKPGAGTSSTAKSSTAKSSTGTSGAKAASVRAAHGWRGWPIRFFGGRFGGVTVTAADGTYTLKHLRVGSYIVCFNPIFATGSSSTTGLLPSCFNASATAAKSATAAVKAGDVRAAHVARLHRRLHRRWQGRSVMATVVTVSSGATTSGIDGTIQPAAEISGTVTDATTGAPVAHVKVLIIPNRPAIPPTMAAAVKLPAAAKLNVGARLNVGGRPRGPHNVTAADGTYAVPGLLLDAAGYTVCFVAKHAVENGTRARLQNQCFDNVAWTGPIPAGTTAVQVSSGANTSGIDAALQAKPAPAGHHRHHHLFRHHRRG